MNKIILMGRLTKSPDVRYTDAGKCVCRFTLAVDRPVSGGNKEADFFDVVLFSKQAEVAGNSLDKGHRALVEGRVQIRQYTAKDGSKRNATEIIANSFEFIEKKGSGGGNADFEGAFGSASDLEEIPFD